MQTLLEHEAYMCDAQRAHFRERLVRMRKELLMRDVLSPEEIEDASTIADPLDRASAEESRTSQATAQARVSRQLIEIAAALGRIDDGTFGYCEDTGEEIGLARLDAYPLARLSIEAQARKERQEKFHWR